MMSLTTDHFVAQGGDHIVCQDYARSGIVTLSEGIPCAWAAVSDGCSASPDTDWGARLLVHEIERSFEAAIGVPNDPFGTIGETAYCRARGVVDQLGLPITCLDATLLLASVDHETIRVGVWGDGVVALRRRDTGAWEVREITFAANYPEYLSYRFDDERRARWEAVIGNERRVATFGIGGVVPAIEQHSGSCWTVSGRDYDAVVLCTDGIGSFREREMRPVALDTPTILEKLLAFKGMSGSFLRRRYQRFKRETQGWWHHDDLGVAAISIQEEMQ